jgi:hypothetical protein
VSGFWPLGGFEGGGLFDDVTPELAGAPEDGTNDWSSQDPLHLWRRTHAVEAAEPSGTAESSSKIIDAAFKGNIRERLKSPQSRRAADLQELLGDTLVYLADIEERFGPAMAELRSIVGKALTDDEMDAIEAALRAEVFPDGPPPQPANPASAVSPLPNAPHLQRLFTGRPL